MRTLVAVPMKAYPNAKTRLACVMTDRERMGIARRLFDYGQSFFSENYPEFDRLVVTPSPMVAASAVWAGASCVYEPVAAGLNAAAATALRWAMDRGYERLVIVPGDIAVWLKDEFDQLLDFTNDFDFVVARSVDGGTNAIVMDLPFALCFQYGPGSAANHVAEARRRGRKALECSLPFLALDVDTPRDRATVRMLGHRQGVAI